MSACSPAPSATAPAAEPASSPMVGADQDGHGCKASAGYTWSPLRGECIRIFEVGLAFAPYDEKINQTLQAFVVMPEPGRTATMKAELYLPGQNEPIALEARPVPEGETQPTVLENKAEGVTIEYARDDYLLVVRGRPLYVRHGQDNTALDALLSKR